MRTTRQRLLAIAAWVAAVVVYAAFWYAYDAARSGHEPFLNYLGYAWMIWLVLTPLVLWFGIRVPIARSNWTRTVPLHIAAGLLFAAASVFVETLIGWMRHGDFVFAEAVRHYFRYQLQVSFVTYWLLVIAVQLYAAFDAARKRELRAARAEAELAAAQLSVLRAQLHPHFMFNTLQAATELIHSDPEGAEMILVELSELLRAALDDSHLQEVPLAHELDLLGHYINIQRRRFGDRLRFQIAVDPALRSCLVPALVLQPLVENAVRHGIARHKEDDTISIDAERRDGRIELRVSNRSSALDDAAPRGIGLANTQERLEHLYPGQCALELRSLQPRGVCAAISIPFRSESAP